MTVSSSRKSSHALVPVVTVRSSRASAWARTIFRSDTGAPCDGWARECPGPTDRIERPAMTARRFRPSHVAVALRLAQLLDEELARHLPVVPRRPDAWRIG